MKKYIAQLISITFRLVGWSSLFFGIALYGAANTQAAGYTASITTAYPQLAINPSDPQIVWAAGNSPGPYPSAYITCDDCISQIMNIGFSFTFGGVAYSRWSMHSNGVIFFETAALGGTGTGTASGTPTYTPNALPTANFGNTNQPALMPFWADLIHNASATGANTVPPQAATASFYQYEVQTVSGAQVLVIQLKNVGYWAAPSNPVNMQIQLWSTGQIVYSYGSLTTLTGGGLLRIGLQYPGGGCNTLANQQSTSLSNQSYLFTWDPAAAVCPAMPTVNHYEIREKGTATLCAEPVTVLACSVTTKPCPSASIINTQIINAAITVTGTGTLGTPNINPVSFNLQPTAPTQTVNLTWAAGSAGTATLGIQTAVSASGTLVCTNVAGTTVSANCNITVANTACVAPPDHYQIVGPANGINCATHTFTIKAWADAAQTTAYTAGVATGTLTQAGNPASLPSLGAFTIAAGSSTVNITPITFPATGTTTFSTTATPALAGATTCNFGGSTSCAFNVYSAGFIFSATNTGGVATLPTQTAGLASAQYYLRAVQTNTSTGACVAALTSPTAVTLGYTCNNPATCSTGNYLDITPYNGATAQTMQTVAPGGTSVNMYFDVNGSAPLTFNYRDVGQLTLNANMTTPITLSGSSNAYVVAPHHFWFSNITAAPIKAGNPFSATITAMNGAATPAATPNFGKESSPESINLTRLECQPTGGSAGNLVSSVGAFNAGAVTVNTLSWSDVGNIDLIATLTSANYLVSGLSVTGNTSLSGTVCKDGLGNAIAGFVGPFVPDHFETAVTQGCGAYTYSGQPFKVTVTAKNGLATPTTTFNYDGNTTPTSFAKTVTLTDGNGSAMGSFNGTNTVAASAFTGGVATVSTPVYTFANQTTTRQTDPTTILLRASDANASSLGFTEGSTTVRAGRVKLSSAYGSELLDLNVPMQAQYWSTATGWVINPLDTCTGDITLGATNVVGVTLPTVTTPAITTCVQDSGNPGLSGAGCAIAGPLSERYKEGATPGVGFAGDFNLWLKAAGAAGAVTVTGSVPPWLTFNWYGAGVVNPTARATFGVYPGNKVFIYQRESY